MRRVALVLMLLLLGSCSSPTTGGVTPDRATDVKRDSDHEGATNFESTNDFEVATFEGTTFALADHRGTPVVLNFWESW